MNDKVNTFASLAYFCIMFVWLCVWIGGVVIAKGTASTLAAVFTGGLWSIYLIIEFILKYHGLL